MQQNRVGGAKLFSLFGRFSLLFVLSISALYAGSFEDFKKTQSASYSKFKDPRDNGFNDYLKAQWQEYQAYITQPMYTQPKPKQITPLASKPAPKVGPSVLIRLPKEINTDTKEAPLKKKLTYDITLDFYGLTLGFNADKEIARYKFYPHTQAGIAEFFSLLASSNYGVTINTIQTYKKQLHLNDWAIYLLVERLAQELYSSRDEARIYQWFLLTKLGFDVKIALSGSDVYLLHYVDKIVYQSPRYKFDNRYYYILSAYDKKAIKKIYTYKEKYPHATKALDFSLKELPKFPKEQVEKQRAFVYEGIDYTLRYTQNKNLLAFMKTYPQVDYSIYFNATMDMRTYREIAKQLKEYCDGKKMADAMNMVLRFVQKAFVYKRDDVQFGHEKVMFADETLFYDASDCEDRAVLYAQLVKRLFGVSVVGIKYSDHMATALYIPMQGESVFYQHKRYVIADPTYVNANIGEVISRYRSIQPEQFIRLVVQ